MLCISLGFLFSFLPSLFGLQMAATPGKKIWAGNINFEEKSNWYGENIPRSCDRAVIPWTASVAIFVQSNHSLREFVFPLEGEIVLNTGASLTFNDQITPCDDPKDVLFVVPSTDEWLDPNSWNVAQDETETVKYPVPETERVPCNYDDVEFPVNSSYRVKIDGAPILVKSAFIDGKQFNSYTFENMIKTPSGKVRFQSSVPVHINNDSCPDLKGCKCRHEKPEIKSFICRLIQCKPLECIDPIKPVGSCCPFCGSLLTINIKSDFEFTRLQKLCSSFMEKSEFEGVAGYISKIDDSRVQALFADTLSTNQAGSLASTIRDFLLRDMDEVGTFGISSVAIQVSSHWNANLLKGSNIGEVFGIVFCMLAAVFFAVYLLYLYKKHGFGGLSFARLQEFKDEEESSESETGITEFAPPEKGFENPLYDEKSQEKSATPEATSVHPIEKSSETRENPAFVVFEELQHLQ